VGIHPALLADDDIAHCLDAALIDAINLDNAVTFQIALDVGCGTNGHLDPIQRDWSFLSSKHRSLLF
jgi:hypothetical protein